MAKRGYRLWTVELRAGMGRGPVDFSAAGPSLDEHYADLVLAQMQALQGQKLHGMPPIRPLENDDPEDFFEQHGPSVPHTRWESSSGSNRVVKFTVTYGRQGEHHTAMHVADDNEADVLLRDRAAADQYRGVLVLPETGSTGVLAIETLGRRNPGKMVTQHLAYDSKKSSWLPGDTKRPPWWRLSVTPVAAPDAISEALKNKAPTRRVRLRQLTVSKGGQTRAKNLELIEHDPTAEEMSQLRALVSEWRALLGSGEEVSDAKGAADMLAVIAPELVGTVEFTDGEVVFDDATGSPLTVRPSALEATFIHRIDTPDPTDQEFYAAVRHRVTSAEFLERIEAELVWT